LIIVVGLLLAMGSRDGTAREPGQAASVLERIPLRLRRGLQRRPIRWPQRRSLAWPPRWAAGIGWIRRGVGLGWLRGHILRLSTIELRQAAF